MDIHTVWQLLIKKDSHWLKQIHFPFMKTNEENLNIFQIGNDWITDKNCRIETYNSRNVKNHIKPDRKWLKWKDILDKKMIHKDTHIACLYKRILQHRSMKMDINGYPDWKNKGSILLLPAGLKFPKT